MRQQIVFAGVTEAQQMLIAYWSGLRDGEGRVRRDSLDPGELRSALACVSILEMDEAGDGRFRIAGSRLREIFGMEVRGMRVAEIVGSHGECYALGLSAALERGEPVGGLIEAGDRTHAWLRLPLVGQDGRLNLVLCHDELLTRRHSLRPGYRDAQPVQRNSSRRAA